MKKHRYIGLDVHKESIAIALAAGGRNGEVREYGTVGGSLLALERDHRLDGARSTPQATSLKSGTTSRASAKSKAKTDCSSRSW